MKRSVNWDGVGCRIEISQQNGRALRDSPGLLELSYFVERHVGGWLCPHERVIGGAFVKEGVIV